MNKYLCSIDHKIYTIVEDFKSIRKDWNCDNDIYTMTVCYMRDIRKSCPSFNIAVTDDEFKEYYKLV